MNNEPLKLSRPLGDIGDAICHKEVFIYHIKDTKVGSTYNLEKRTAEQGFDLEDVEVLVRLIGGHMTYNHIWRIEQILARSLGFQDEHDGNRHAVNRVRASRLTDRSRSYRLTKVTNLTDTTTPETILVERASEFEGEHDLFAGVLASCANPKKRNKYVELSSSKYAVEYNDN
jgi:hypothetical protein